MAESFSFTDDEIQLLLEVSIEYKAQREYCGVDWESVFLTKRLLFSLDRKLAVIFFKLMLLLIKLLLLFISSKNS